ncbi:helix-turn-helix transcriptional regulator [Herbiconiux sp. CPCC 205763]|uniref:Helix-turn-helix transcriptional regulator n=1 Tax=Herbiconiux aconitum TaxID=2970913 RepID=A0ABT2GPN1_9MICO|nr:helix-turn-helix transcriptional regulator [Herbiconiux aconitum]MCS5718133.1 helix-turn-helix transcriptional regulator [Herbiconiux aconitum]
MVNSPLGEYLRARRAAVRPEDVGLTTMPGRRVEGLRREEVAELAGISPEYYLRLEQGRGHQPSDQVLRSLARALMLDAAAVRYMTRLVSLQSGARRASRTAKLPEAVRAGFSGLLDQWSSTPAYLTDRNQSLIAFNDLARAILPGAWRPGANLVLQIFSDDWRASDRDWEASANRAVSALRFYGDPGDPVFRDIVGLLSMRDPDFRRMWAIHEAAPLVSGELHLDVGRFGRVSFDQQSLTPAGDENHIVTILHAAPGSVSADAIRSLKVAA